MFLERYDPLKQEIVCILGPAGSCNDTLRTALDKQQICQLYRQMWWLRLYNRKKEAQALWYPSHHSLQPLRHFPAARTLL